MESESNYSVVWRDLNDDSRCLRSGGVWMYVVIGSDLSKLEVVRH